MESKEVIKRHRQKTKVEQHFKNSTADSDNVVYRKMKNYMLDLNLNWEKITINTDNNCSRAQLKPQWRTRAPDNALKEL